MQLDLEKIKKVTEYHLRKTAKYEEDLENGWKDSIKDVNNNPITLKTNFKLLRDAISNIILDILTDVSTTGELSIGNTKGSVNIQKDNSKMKFDKEIILNNKKVSVQGDLISILETFRIWLNTHTHGTSMGPTLPPIAPFSDSNIGQVPLL